jgi:WD40 repeat protein
MPLKFLAAEDIFISYTRRDASTYVAGLAEELTKRGFSCFTDKLGTDPNADLPDMLKRKIKSCSMLVVICTEWSGTRQTIEEEIGEFLSTGRRTSIVPVDFDDAVYKARWYKLIEGIAPEPEKHPHALDDGEPSPAVVSRIEKQFKYMRRNVRLRRITYATAAVLGVLILASVVAAVYAGQQLKNAESASRQAADARRDAESARGQAREEQAKAEAAGREAREAQARAEKAQDAAKQAEADAEQAKAEAAAQKRLADVAAADAREKTRLAAEAARRAQIAQAEADRQQRIGESRSDASRAQTILQRNPDELRRSVLIAIGALKKSRTVEADGALRESVGLLPRLHRRVVYRDEVEAVALSPDGRHYASVKDKTLRVYESGSETPLKEMPCDCGRVALSNGLAFAAVRDKEGYMILDLKGGGTRIVKLKEGFNYGDFTLSPGGDYLAHSARPRDEFGCGFDHVEVVDTRSGEVVKTLAEEFHMNVEDVSFGPTGILAAGGAGCVEQQEAFGRVVIWPLKYESQDGAVESLSADSFAPQVSEYHDLPVRAVAPGPSVSSYATDRGVWRIVWRNLYEPVALLPLIGSKPIVEALSDIRRSNYDVSLLALSPAGDRVTLVRQLMEAENGRTVYRKQLEVWDSTGHQETARVYERDVASMAFRPGGRLVVARVNQAETPLRVFDADDGTKVKDNGVELVKDELLSKWTDRTSSDLRFVLAAGEGAVRVVDTWESKTTSIPFNGLFPELSATALTPDGAFLALSGKSEAEGGGDSVIVYRRSEGNAYAEWSRLQLDESVSGMELSAGGRYLAVLSKTVRVWELSQKRDVTPAGLRQVEGFGALRFSPEGHFLATLNFVNSVVQPVDVRVWRLADGVELESLKHTGSILVCLFSPRERLLLTAGEDRVTRLLDLSTGRARMLGDDTRIQTAAFSPDGSLFGVGSDEGVVEVYLTDGSDTSVARLKHVKAINALAFSEDNRRLATASGLQGGSEIPEGWENEENFPVRFWLLRPEDLIAEAQTRLDALPPKVNR